MNMSLINRQFLNTLFHDNIHRIFILMKVREINAREHDNFEWFKLNFYIDDKLADDTKIIVHFKKKVHIVDDFRAKLFINNNIFEFESISIHLKRRELIINNYEITTLVFIKTQNDRIKKIIRSHKQVIVSTHAIMTIFVKYKNNILFTNRNYNFSFKTFKTLNAENEFFVYIMSVNVVAIQMKNASNTSFVIFKNMKINDLHDYKKENCYMINIDNRHLVAVSTSDWTKRIKQFAKYAALTNLIIMSVLDGAVLSQSSTYIVILITFQANNDTASSFSSIKSTHINAFNPLYLPFVSETNLSIQKTIMFNDVIIFDDVFAYARLFTIMKFFLKIWRNINDTVNVSKSQWMFILTILNAKSLAIKIYSLNSKNKKMINKKFDWLHEKEKMSWTKRFTIYNYSIFVVWRIVNDERKEKIMIDIRKLNKIFEFDAYSMFFQLNVTAAVMSASYISVMNCASFFHQWFVKLKNKHKLMMINHRENEQWNVIVMKYKNSSVYVQRQINSMFKSFKEFVRAYVNDVVVFFNSLKKHLRHLIQIFKLFKKMNIIIKISKTFLKYLTIALLDQKMNNLNMMITNEKFVAIQSFRFLILLKHLKTYFDKIKYFRQYVSYYVQKVKLLQNRKTRLLQDESIKDAIKKRHARNVTLNESTFVEINSFQQLQDNLNKSTFLIHFNKIKRFYINIDVSQKRDYEVMIYHVKKNMKRRNHPLIRNNVLFIMFLNKILSKTKTRYWLTKFKMIAFVWTVRKLCLIIFSSNHSIIIYTDHDASSSIVS